MVTAAAQAGDAVARGGVRADRPLARASGLADLVQILDPQVLVVGGGVIDAGRPAAGPDPRGPIVDSLAQRGRLPVAEVRAAEMGNTAGVVGAADLARRR